MTNDVFVSTNQVFRTYSQGGKAVRALEAVSCEVKAGARIALVGPSGSGKSTLLHLMAGIDVPTEGEVIWPALGGREELRPRKIGVVFQSMSLITTLDVVENIELPMLLSGTNPTEARAAALQALADMGLESIAQKLPEELSGGQAQRVAAARALASRPRLLLADEPTGQLDHSTAKHLFDVLLGSLASSDTALVVATHDAAVAGLMDTVWTMRHGRLETEK